MAGIDTIVLNTTIFLIFNFIAEPIGVSAVALVFGGIEYVDRATVVVRLVVGIDAWGVVVVIFEGEVEALINLPSELEVEVLLLVAGGHYILDFGVGQEGEVGFEVFLRSDVLFECLDGHVESDGLQAFDSHGFVCQSSVREGGVEGVIAIV